MTACRLKLSQAPVSHCVQLCQGYQGLCCCDCCCPADVAHVQLPQPAPDPRMQVGPLQREHVLRLLHAPAFTRQLAGVKQLSDLLASTFYQAPLQQGIEVRALLAVGQPVCTVFMLPSLKRETVRSY